MSARRSRAWPEDSRLHQADVPLLDQVEELQAAVRVLLGDRNHEPEVVDGDKCDACGARMKLRALVIAARSIERLLAHLREPTEPPPLSPARGPPFFKSRAVRRKMGDLDASQGQVEMFGA